MRKNFYFSCFISLLEVNMLSNVIIKFSNKKVAHIKGESHDIWVIFFISLDRNEVCNRAGSGLFFILTHVSP
jgi:hypothetical protein